MSAHFVHDRAASPNAKLVPSSLHYMRKAAGFTTRALPRLEFETHARLRFARFGAIFALVGFRTTVVARCLRTVLAGVAFLATGVTRGRGETLLRCRAFASFFPKARFFRGRALATSALGVRPALFPKELLLVCGEEELRPAVSTGKPFVRIPFRRRIL